MYGINSDSGFFYISVLSEKSASSLASQGYTVIEDFQLDFHSTDEDKIEKQIIQNIMNFFEINFEKVK